MSATTAGAHSSATGHSPTNVNGPFRLVLGENMRFTRLRSRVASITGGDHVP
jgi:hypothetical protein